MKAQIVYIKGHSESEKQAQEALKSFNKSNKTIILQHLNPLS